MSRLVRLFSNVTALFCEHEWARRVERRRVYLECVQCLATTPGLDLDSGSRPGTEDGRRALRPAA